MAKVVSKVMTSPKLFCIDSPCVPWYNGDSKERKGEDKVVDTIMAIVILLGGKNVHWWSLERPPFLWAVELWIARN